MSRNNHHYPSPLSNRGRERYDHPFSPPFRQALVDLICGGLGDPGYRGIGSPGRLDTGPIYPGYHDSRDFYPPPEGFGPRNGGPEPQALRPTFQNSRPRPSMAGQGKKGEPIGKAMKKLHKLLGTVEDMYSNFQSQFDSEMEPIKKYAASDSKIEDLWKDKVAGKKSNVENNETEEGEKFGKKHDDAKKKLNTALYEAVHSTVGEGHQSRKAKLRMENAERLRQKVETASVQIVGLLEKVPDDRDYCDSLLAELQLLTALVNPQEPKNKILFRSGDGDGDEESDAEGDEDAQGGGFY